MEKIEEFKRSLIGVAEMEALKLFTQLALDDENHLKEAAEAIKACHPKLAVKISLLFQKKRHTKPLNDTKKSDQDFQVGCEGTD